MACQSDTRKPWKPSSPLSTSVKRYFWACIFVSFQLLKETMMLMAPLLTAVA